LPSSAWISAERRLGVAVRLTLIPALSIPPVCGLAPLAQRFDTGYWNLRKTPGGPRILAVAQCAYTDCSGKRGV
jgi:hypothetical protein